MFFLKIKNIKTDIGTIDYKGLNINLFVPGTQSYPHDLSENNYCLVATKEEVTESEDVSILTKSEYLEEKKSIQLTHPTEPDNTIEDFGERLEATELALLDLLLMGGM